MGDLASMREQVYTDPRPKEHFDRFHERARTREPDWAYELTRFLTSLYAYTFFRARPISTEKVPGSGAVILAPNHFSFMDHFLMGCYIRRKVRFMAKSQLFSGPMQFIYTHGGVFPVRRGARDEEMFVTANAILARGGAITMYCEGGRSRDGKLADHAKAGIGRLVLETGAPVVPIAIHGSSRIRNWKRLQFPKVTIQYGDPIRWEPIEGSTREQQQAVADEVLAEIKGLYNGLEQHGRKGMLRRAREQRRAERRARVKPKGAATA
jgi:1-acyl-sn-glycerol-3-phosphate acyltransferase